MTVQAGGAAYERGDKVKITRGAYRGRKGTVVSVADYKGQIEVIVKPDGKMIAGHAYSIGLTYQPGDIEKAGENEE